IRESDNSQVQYREQSQQYPLGSREAENSPEIRTTDIEEEPRANEYVTDEESLQSLHVLSSSVSASAQQGVVIRCPICMEFYSEILQHGQQLVVTLCGHVFCSRCLPVALETAHMCPTCRVEQYPEEYINIFL
ncbi:RNF4 ligase, partial [Loxia curvirostra]|nr:RNF4 ligase [Loxia curvirostra]